jgi:RNA polymerase sigma factor (sigma-70 family)
MITDLKLIAQYTTTRSADWLAEIVARHGAMVWRTCRRLTDSAQDAEDAAQATFLVLAQKPEAVRENLAGWLHRVARNAAFRVARERTRRIRREEASARMRSPPANPAQGAELREELDGALDQLPERLREAVVLRYLEGRDYADAARLAGCTETTLRWRSMQGLHRLRAILARREVVFTLGALAASLAHEGAAAAATTTSLTAWAATLSVTGTETTRAAVVAKGVLKAMYWAKVKFYACIAGGAVFITGATAPLLLSSPEPPPVAISAAVMNPVQLGINASLGGKRPFSDDDPWNLDVSQLPADSNSDRLIATLGRDTSLFPNFGPTIFDGAPQGIPYIVIAGNEPKVPATFIAVRHSDPGPYPLPRQLPLKPEHLGKPGCPMIILDRDNWKLYELDVPRHDAGGWRATTGAIFDLKSGRLGTGGRFSADIAGMPVFPGLVRWDEVVEQKAIHHALRFSGRRIRSAHVAPAQFSGGNQNDPNLPPLGIRVRLKASYDISGFSPNMQVILTALKKHGMFLAEYGMDWHFSGTYDPRWDDPELKSLTRIKGKDFEVVRLGEVQVRK